MGPTPGWSILQLKLNVRPGSVKALPKPPALTEITLRAQGAAPQNVLTPHWFISQPVLPSLGSKTKMCHKKLSFSNLMLKFLPHKISMSVHISTKFQHHTIKFDPSTELPKTAESHFGFP